MNDCIFCQVIQGKEDAKIIYEDKNVLCFFPKQMEVYGHTLIIPKQHFPNIYEIPSELLSSLIETIQLLAKEYKNKIGATGINILHASGKDAQQSVFHFHFHMFPRFKDDGLDTWPKLASTVFDVEEIFKKLNGI